jgi:hypothetical protein
LLKARSETAESLGFSRRRGAIQSSTAQFQWKNLPVKLAPATEPSGVLVERDCFIGSSLQAQLANQTVRKVCLAALLLRERCADLIPTLNLKLSGSKHLINDPGDFFARGLVCAREDPGKFA